MTISGKKVWFVAHQATMGGAERCLLEMIDVYIELGADCYVLVPDEGLFTYQLENRNVGYSVVKYRWWVSTNDSLIRRIARRIVNALAARKVRKIFANVGADLVITNTVTVPIGAEAAHYLNVPHVWVIQEFGEEDHGLKFDKGLKKSTSKIESFSDAIFINSKAVMNKYQKWISDSKLHLLYYYFNPPDIKESKSEKFSNSFAIVGAIQPGKGQKLAIRAISQLKREGFEASLDIYGDGRSEYIEDMKKTINQENSNDYVTWHGKIPSAWESIYKSDVLLVCSKAEAFGRITAEAMLMQTSVIASASGGSVELIGEQQERGYLFQPDNVKDLVRVLKRVMEDTVEREKKVIRAKMWADEMFTKEKYKQTIKEVIGKI